MDLVQSGKFLAFYCVYLDSDFPKGSLLIGI